MRQEKRSVQEMVSAHSCVFQRMVVEGKREPAKRKCLCRKKVSYQEANRMVDRGEAKWFVASRKRIIQKNDCTQCGGLEAYVKTCDLCKGTGLVELTIIQDMRTNDVVLVTHSGKKISTPRAPTIEVGHMERSIDFEGATKRIHEYQDLQQAVLNDTGAWIYSAEYEMGTLVKKTLIKRGKVEPSNVCKSFPPGSITFSDGSKNKTWWWQIEGRDLDKGRAV